MKKVFYIFLFFFVLIIFFACKKVEKKDYLIKPVEFTNIKIKDSFWYSRMEINRKVTIPYAFNKCEETGRIDNFAKAAGIMEGKFIGRRYNDSDVFKVMEGASYSLSTHPDPKLEKHMDELIEKIAGAQEEDGYLYTARTIDPKNPPEGAGEKRWSNLGSSHELYNAGHMYEAAVAYYLATGKRNFLRIAIKNADFIAKVFGPDKKRGFPGHQEIEIGLVKLYRVTGKKKYLDLAKFFLDERGSIEHKKMFSKDSDFSIYNQDWYLQAHKPVIEQKEAIGHAVRATYMYSGMADIAAITGNLSYINAINNIWDNVVSKKIYITGGIGARHEGEAFGANYELPNATAYNETCAAIGNVFWNHRLFLLHGEGKYMDVLERTLYNGLISGVSLQGDKFFYPNPLEADGEYKFNQGAATRKPWFSCACCPVNITRFISSFPRYIYAKTDNEIYINLFVQSEAELDTRQTKVKIIQNTEYPWSGYNRITIIPKKEKVLSIKIRIPGWSRNKPIPSNLYEYLNDSDKKVKVTINKNTVKPTIKKGYISINRKWKKGDIIELNLPMPIRRIVANEKVKADRGKVALQRGPIVYCFEGVDNNGHVLNKVIPDEKEFTDKYRAGLLGGVNILKSKTTQDEPQLMAVPYYAWSNRGIGEMSVWMLRDKEK